MKHARDDYDRIQDPMGKIPHDEPVFLIRGQDMLAPIVLREYAIQNEMNHGDPAITHMVLNWARHMEDWQHMEGRKMPDLPWNSQYQGSGQDMTNDDDSSMAAKEVIAKQSRQ